MLTIFESFILSLCVFFLKLNIIIEKANQEYINK